MKIAHLAFTSLPRTVGGLEVVVDQLIRQQKALGHDVTLVTRWNQWQAMRTTGFQYRALPLPPRPNLGSAPFQSVGSRSPVAAAIRWHQWRERFDLWHIHWLYPTGWMAHDALARSGTPMIVTPHGADLQVDEETGYGYRQYAMHDARVREMAPKVQAFTAISQSIEDRLCELGVNPGRITRISNGVDAARIGAARQLRDATRARLGVRPDTAVILSIGRNEPNKGFQFVPGTLAQLVGQGRKVRWIIVGAGSEKLGPVMEAAGMSAHVQLFPPIRSAPGSGDHPPDELAHLYAAADVVAVPSVSESFGLVAIEAMAAGTPVVGNNAPGIRDVIAHGTDGLLCEARTPVAMAGAICAILDDPDLAARLRNEGMKKAAIHDWPKIAAQYVSLYGSLVEQG